MEYIKLGKSGLTVSRLCFGALIIGPLQANLSVEEGAGVIAKALESGVSFIDTAEIYETYAHIREGIKKSGIRPVIATKSYAYTAEGARQSLEKARKELDTDVIDIFLMHEQESEHTLRGHREALEYYISQKEKGIIKAVGISTHHVQAVKACLDMEEIDVIHPIINKDGIGICDGTVQDMLDAVKKAYERGKGIYGMKPLGGGNLLRSYRECMDFVLGIPFVHSIAMGMQCKEEVIMNVNTFNGTDTSEEITSKLDMMPRKLFISDWCEGCGKCVERCGQGALKIVEGKARVSKEKCVLCGYCGGVCPVFAIKVC
ncbi:MAG: aldo/keto reductase [Bacillota bacterium]|nr:aldo/keto reductase [Bacillota bacterium]